MATAAEFPGILRAILEDYARIQPAVGEIESELIIDEAKGHYEIIRIGWLNGYRVHGTIIHVDIRDGKFWIQHDGTEAGISSKLVASGVPHHMIVLAFKSPEMRKYTDFAVS